MAKRTPDADPIQQELDSIKRLMIMFLLRDGAKQSEIASVLGLSQSSISRMFPGGIVKLSNPNHTLRN
jgi:DNA-directed RNA polymerase specialized sigma subunit